MGLTHPSLTPRTSAAFLPRAPSGPSDAWLSPIMADLSVSRPSDRQLSPRRQFQSGVPPVPFSPSLPRSHHNQTSPAWTQLLYSLSQFDNILPSSFTSILTGKEMEEKPSTGIRFSWPRAQEYHRFIIPASDCTEHMSPFLFFLMLFFWQCKQFISRAFAVAPIVSSRGVTTVIKLKACHFSLFLSTNHIQTSVVHRQCCHLLCSHDVSPCTAGPILGWLLLSLSLSPFLSPSVALPLSPSRLLSPSLSRSISRLLFPLCPSLFLSHFFSLACSRLFLPIC